jgi:hypothetical protein
MAFSKGFSKVGERARPVPGSRCLLRHLTEKLRSLPDMSAQLQSL